MKRDFVRLVQNGYDKIARAYLAWREQEPLLFRAELQDLAARLPPNAAVLDAGCGAGVPFTLWLSERFAVTGIDLSAEQIALAKRLGLPLVIHTRDAWPATFDVLDVEGIPERVIFHCFTGDEAEARAAVARGAWLSFSGIVTFSKADDILRAAKFCPADKLLTETDAPWLAPVPHRGKENEPSLVRLVGECLAQVRGENVDDVARTTTANAHAAFPGIAR